MAKYTIEDSTLTAISNPIKTLMGLTDKLTPSAMATNLNDANTEVTDQSALISQIMSALSDKSAGGGKVATGSVTFNEDTPNYYNFTVTHNLGTIPNFFSLLSKDVEIISGARYGKQCVLFCPDIRDVSTYIDAYLWMSSTTSASWSYQGSNNGGYLICGTDGGSKCKVNKVTETTAQFCNTWGSYRAVFQAGKTYDWLVGVI